MDQQNPNPDASTPVAPVSDDRVEAQPQPDVSSETPESFQTAETSEADAEPGPDYVTRADFDEFTTEVRGTLERIAYTLNVGNSGEDDPEEAVFRAATGHRDDPDEEG